jgi:trehalose-6-phosphate synthase
LASSKAKEREVGYKIRHHNRAGWWRDREKGSKCTWCWRGSHGLEQLEHEQNRAQMDERPENRYCFFAFFLPRREEEMRYSKLCNKCLSWYEDFRLIS